jgi:hypothetical protein
VDNNALPGQPGYLDPDTGMVVPPSGMGNLGGNTIVVKDTNFPTTDRDTAFYVTDNIDGVETQVLNESEPFNKDDIAYENGIFTACVENDNDGNILCATHAGSKFDSTKAEEVIVRKLRSVNPSSNGFSANTTPNEILQHAVTIATQIKYPIQESKYPSLVNKFLASCNALRGDAKETCDRTGSMLSNASANLTQAVTTLGSVGRMTGGSRKRGGIANRKKHRR